MDDEMRREFSKLYDALIHVGAKNDFGWISLAFTVNYVLLGIILWRFLGRRRRPPCHGDVRVGWSFCFPLAAGASTRGVKNVATPFCALTDAR